MNEPRACVVAVARDREHAFSKPKCSSIRLLVGFGVEGDAHLGTTVQHRSRVAQDPTQPNLRQVHLIGAEVFGELAAAGFAVGAGELGENVTTHGIELAALPVGARLRLGDAAVVEVTGLRNPCQQINDFRQGLMEALLGRDAEGEVVRKAGVMAVVLAGGDVRPGDAVAVELPPPPHRRLGVV